MAIQTFSATYLAKVGSSRTTTTRILKVAFGDGYSIRAQDGLNPIRDTWNLTWDNLDRSDADIIETFLTARGGFEAFLWVPPAESVARKWTCGQWSRSPLVGLYDRVTAIFSEEFDN